MRHGPDSHIHRRGCALGPVHVTFLVNVRPLPVLVRSVQVDLAGQDHDGGDDQTSPERELGEEHERECGDDGEDRDDPDDGPERSAGRCASGQGLPSFGVGGYVLASASRRVTVLPARRIDPE